MLGKQKSRVENASVDPPIEKATVPVASGTAFDHPMLGPTSWKWVSLSERRR